MGKVDLKAVYKDLYTAPKDRFAFVEPPPLTYLMVDGEGDPNTAPAYMEAVEALYGVAYALKFASKAAGRDYVVPPLEGLWWADDMAAFRQRAKAKWRWTMMILQPDWISPDQVKTAVEKAGVKNPTPALSRLRSERFEEGRCVQVLHVGPYDAEGPILARLHDEFLPERGLVPVGKHHEIYLGDPRKSAPEKLRTILRQPVRAA